MAFARPTYAQLVTRIAGDMRSQLLAAGKRADPLLRRSKVWVLSRVYAAMFHVLYGVLEWLGRQILPSTATDLDYLKDYGRAFGVTWLEAQKATGTVRFTGTNTTVVPSGTEFVRDDGVVYVTTASGTISGGQADIAAEADLAGLDGNMDAGTALTLSSPIAGIDSEVSWVSGFDAGTDDEQIEELRTRILARMRETPHGGSKADYEMWAREVTGVFRALCVPLARGAGTVDVYFLHESGTGFGIPTGGQITTVQTYLDEVRPVTADVEAKAPSTATVAFTIDALDPDTVDTRAAIAAELDALFLNVALVEGSETIGVSQFYAAIDAAEGVESFTLTTPAAPVTATTGQVLTRGVVTYT